MLESFYLRLDFLSRESLLRFCDADESQRFPTLIRRMNQGKQTELSDSERNRTKSLFDAEILIEERVFRAGCDRDRDCQLDDEIVS